MGAYRGKAGFDTFGHRRSVVGTDLPFSVTGMAAPPVSETHRRLRRTDVADGARRTRKRLNASRQRPSGAHGPTQFVSGAPVPV